MQFQGTKDYVATEDLKVAVNAAVTLERPLLVKGEPGNNPMTLVYKVYVDGFRGNDLGGSSAQSVILMVLVLALTVFQFRLVERRIHYT